ncbi:PadR family transcriptional regulator [Halobacillus kuroshimensis]|uniref:PadR family transcriptional regulator n=1 Tax=Halobacillus kuroshimensis TaxID=302481 RepID=A0ABS3DRT7_9BACI|nr:PadR family transcriptional regulator [Halobacillus kuroshimensis]MBN8234060.1 PadR family transcriptional regulator [Halobacillus kuroshimensis]
MENRLRKLKQALNHTSFNTLTFDQEHRNQVMEKIDGQDTRPEQIRLSILQLLVQEETGYTLAGKIRSRGIKTFENDQGALYTTLHILEQKRCIQSEWKEDGQKCYQLTRKGRKLLKKYESSPDKPRVLRTLVEAGQI